MRSAWLCSRNDIVANVLVIAAGGAVWALGSRWPDVVAMVLASAVSVVRDASRAITPAPGRCA